MNRRFWIAALAALALGLGLGSCEEITTRTRTTTLTAHIDVTGSSFVDGGDYLVGDQVRFTARVTEGNEEVPSGDFTFSSDVESVVRIDDPSTGEATFVGVGTTPIRVTIGEPGFEGSAQQLEAMMSVTVVTFTVDLSLTSTLTNADVDPDNALVDDELRVAASVKKGDADVTSSIGSIVSNDTDVIDPAAASGADRVALVGAGPAMLTVRFDFPDVPGQEPLTAQLAVTVKEFTQEMNAVSLVSGHLEDGDTLVTDLVALRATVVRGMSETLKDATSQGTVWTSSHPSIVTIVDDTTAVFSDTGTAVLSVSFTDLDLPGEPFDHPVRVTTFEPSLRLVSEFLGDLTDQDTLLSDSVVVLTDVIATFDGAVRASEVARVEALPDSSRILPVDNAVAANEIVFVDTGAATLRVTLAEPTLPDSTLVVSLPMRVATYLAAIDPPDQTPIMGDTVDYGVTVTHTRPPGGMTVTNPSVTFSSTDPSVIQILDASAGQAFIRDTGQARVAVVSNDPALPAAIVSDTSDVTDITVERFYGAFSDTTGTFGQMPGTPLDGDAITVLTSAVHGFTDSTRVEFPNGRRGFVAVTQPQLVWLVPAGADTGQLILRNLVDDQGGFRDNVPIRFEFNGPGTAVVDDFFEDNDTMPLALKDSIEFDPDTPFEALLAIDHNKAAPADTNFFYFRIDLLSTLDVVAEWQEDADIDFKLCPAQGGPPPTGYGVLCPHAAADNSSDLRREQTSETLSIGHYVLAIYCNADSPNPTPCPANFPITYRLTISQQL